MQNSTAKGQRELVEKMLSGSQAKTAFALRQNIGRMISGESPLVLREFTDKKGVVRKSWVADKPENLNCCAFLTLTVGDSMTHKDAMENRFERALTLALSLTAGMDLILSGATEEKIERVKKRCEVAEYHFHESTRMGNSVPADGDCHFVQVWNSSEASRRINNLNRHLLPEIFERAVIVTERHKNKAVHFHLVGILRGRPDIRTGFDFKAFRRARDARDRGKPDDAAEIRYKLSTSQALSGVWATLREKLPGYGFGRAELTPIEHTGEQVASYVAKYVEKNVCNRCAEDKHKKLVRYLGDWAGVLPVERPDKFAERIEWIEIAKRENQPVTLFGLPESGCWKLKPNDFSWAGQRAWAWWNKAAELSGLCGWVETSKVKFEVGPRWAFKLASTWKEFCGDDMTPGIPDEPAVRKDMANHLLLESRKHWMRLNAGLTKHRIAESSMEWQTPQEMMVAYWDETLKGMDAWISKPKNRMPFYLRDKNRGAGDGGGAAPDIVSMSADNQAVRPDLGGFTTQPGNGAVCQVLPTQVSVSGGGNLADNLSPSRN